MSRGLTSLSRAMALGFVRDRTALFFTILFPLMFLVLFGGIFKDQTAPRSEVVQIGPVAAARPDPGAGARRAGQGAARREDQRSGGRAGGGAQGRRGRRRGAGRARRSCCTTRRPTR